MWNKYHVFTSQGMRTHLVCLRHWRLLITLQPTTSETSTIVPTLTLVHRGARGDMIEVFKILHGYYDPECVPYLKPSSYTSTRGNDKKLFKLYCRLDVRKYCLTPRVVSNWNSLPSDVVNAPSINAFKNRLHKFQVVIYSYKADLTS